MVFVVGVNESWKVAESDESGAAPPVCVAADEASEAGNILDARRSALSPCMSVCTVQDELQRTRSVSSLSLYLLATKSFHGERDLTSSVMWMPFFSSVVLSRS